MIEIPAAKLDRFDYLIGLTESAAFELTQDAGFCPRIVGRDDEPIRVTYDRRFDRLNLYIINNRVTKWYIG